MAVNHSKEVFFYSGKTFFPSDTYIGSVGSKRALNTHVSHEYSLACVFPFILWPLMVSLMRIWFMHIFARSKKAREPKIQQTKIAVTKI